MIGYPLEELAQAVKARLMRLHVDNGGPLKAIAIAGGVNAIGSALVIEPCAVVVVGEDDIRIDAEPGTAKENWLVPVDIVGLVYSKGNVERNQTGGPNEYGGLRFRSDVPRELSFFSPRLESAEAGIMTLESISIVGVDPKGTKSYIDVKFSIPLIGINYMEQGR